MNNTNKVSEVKVLKLLDLTSDIQNLKVVDVETSSVCTLKQLGTLISEYVSNNITKETVEEYDIDFDVIDSIFHVVTICDAQYTLIQYGSIHSLSKERLAYFLMNLESLKNMLLDSAKDYVEEEEETNTSSSKELAVVKEEGKGELMPKSFFQSGDMMENFMFNQIMSTFGNNAMVSMALMEKKQQGKLTKDVLQNLVSMIPDGYIKSPWTAMMIMNLLEKL